MGAWSWRVARLRVGGIEDFESYDSVRLSKRGGGDCHSFSRVSLVGFRRFPNCVYYLKRVLPQSWWGHSGWGSVVCTILLDRLRSLQPGEQSDQRSSASGAANRLDILLGFVCPGSYLTPTVKGQPRLGDIRR